MKTVLINCAVSVAIGLALFAALAHGLGVL